VVAAGAAVVGAAGVAAVAGGGAVGACGAAWPAPASISPAASIAVFTPIKRILSRHPVQAIEPPQRPGKVADLARLARAYTPPASQSSSAGVDFRRDMTLRASNWARIWGAR